MIYFFRRIKQRLLTENKFSKYLMYAIGEIVLVVIGILIALQINNWNEEKKSQQQLNDYLILMLDELYKDGEFLEEGLSRSNTNINYLNAISEGTYSDLSIDDFPSIIGRSMANKKFGTTYDNIKSDGSFNLIENNELKKSINSYYEDDIATYSAWASWHQKFTTENIEGHIIFNLPIKKGYKTDAEFLLGEFEKGKYLSMVNYQLTFLNDFRVMCIETIDANHELVSLIEERLKE